MQDILSYIKKELSPQYPDTEIRSLIRIILLHVCHIQNYEILSCKDIKISEPEQDHIREIVQDLKRHKPIQQILKETEFYGLAFIVNQHVLIPRPETEELVDLILNNHRDKSGLRIIDIGTGSGCIAVALARYLKDSDVYAADISKDALLLAQENARTNQVMVQFIEKDILNDSIPGIPEALDIIVSNPPYVTISEMSVMEKNVLDYEPHIALFVPDDNPIIFYEKIALMGLKYLSKGGSIYFEINPGFGNEICNFLENVGYSNAKIFSDISGKERIIHAIRQ